MAKINFTKGEKFYTAEFQINGPTAIHIERNKVGPLYLKQKSVENGQYDFVKDFGYNRGGDLTIDTAIQGVVYPMWIKIESASEPTLAEMVEGEQSGGGAGNADSGDWEYYDVSSTVGSSDNRDMLDIVPALSGLGKLVDYRNNVITTKKIGPLLYAYANSDYEYYSQVAINMATPCIDLNGSYTLREAIEQAPNSELAAAYSVISAFPRITKEQFYNLEA